MRVVCHIGTPKTATSYLQETLGANTEWLAKHGILYPDMKSGGPNHMSLHFIGCTTPDVFARSQGLESAADITRFRKTLKSHLKQQIDAAPAHIHTVVLSSENLTGNMPTEGQAVLRAFLSDLFDEVEIIVYVRRQDDAILSMYAEHMRMGYSSQTFDDFIGTAMHPKTGLRYLYVRRMLNGWRSQFGVGAVKVRLFDKSLLRQGDILTDFLGCVMNKGSIDLGGITPSDFKRDSLSAPALEFLRMIRPMIPFGIRQRANPVRRKLSKKIDALPRTPKPQMSYEQSMQIMAHFITANTWLQKSYFSSLDAGYFGPNGDLLTQTNLGQISIEEFKEYSATLFGR